MRKTKIIGTVGPACMDYSILKDLVIAGLDVVRINLSHATQDSMSKIMKNVTKLRKELNVALPVMIDTRGPEIRVGKFKENSVEIKKGQTFVFDSNSAAGDNKRVSLNVPKVINKINIKDKILANDGLIVFEVIEKSENRIVTKAKNSGFLSSNKSLCIPNVEIPNPYLNSLDKKDILWAIENNVELVAISFVNSAKDVNDVKKFIAKNNGNMKIISKIESQQGIKNIDSIIDASDGIMVARGDLGVEMSVEVLPELQKLIIKKCTQKGKTVITATEMLESMIYNCRPTRAEVSDVANAVYDGTSCVMLSGETASGKYPVEAVRTMAKVCVVTEKSTNYNVNFKTSSNTVADFISFGVAGASSAQEVKLIVTFTTGGTTAGLISKCRPKSPIIAITPNETTYRQMEILWGVKPVLSPLYNSTDEMFKIANEIVKANKLAKVGEKIVVTTGTPKQNGGTNLMKIIEVS